MSYSSVFLLVLGLFPMIKNGASLKCYSNDAENCMKYTDAPSAFKECMKNKEKASKAQCPPGATVCIKARIKVDSGGEQFTVKGCGEDKSDCNVLEKAMRYKPDCDTCDSDSCNKTTPTAPISFGILIFSILVHFIF